MKVNRKILFLATCFLLFYSCGSPVAPLTNEEIQNLNISFACSTLDVEEDLPMSEVYIALKGSRILLDTINSCEIIPRSDFNKYKIPPEALAACGGWWAGAGDYFYAIAQERKIIIMQGWQEEIQQYDSYHYDPIKTIGAD